MSWAHVQGTGGQATGGVSSFQATFSGSVTAGNLIVVSVSTYIASGTISVADNKNAGNYTQAVRIDGNTNYTSAIYYLVAGTGGASFTITLTGTGTIYPAISIDEYSFTAGASISVDGTATMDYTNTPTPATSTAIVPTASDLIFASVSTWLAATFTAGTGFTLRYNVDYGSGSPGGIGSEDYVNESGSITPGFTLSATAFSVMTAAAFKATVAGGPTTATLSGPTSGKVGSASTNFTITLDQPAAGGGVSCPVSSSYAGDTVTSSPVSIAASGTTGTFTITPHIPGSRNVILGATTPSLTLAGTPIAYTASPVPEAAGMLASF